MLTNSESHGDIVVINIVQRASNRVLEGVSGVDPTLLHTNAGTRL